MIHGISTKTNAEAKGLGKIRNYNEVIAYLDGITQTEYSKHSVARTAELNAIFGNIAEKIETILISGTNGKSLTTFFTAKLLKEEGFKVAVLYASHFLTHTERILIAEETISNKHFTEFVNEVINANELHQIHATTHEILTIAGLLFAHHEKADVLIAEVATGGKYDATMICKPCITALTRVAHGQTDILGTDLDATAFEMMEIAKEGSFFISAEQSKIRLQKMKAFAETKNLKWAMPTRKLTSLPYLFEQLYGRTAALGERIAQMYTEDIKGEFSPFLRGNILATVKGQRGRPTLEAKRNAELNPSKTLQSFWAEHFSLPKNHFELLDKEKPTVLLDNAKNLDALENLFLGIRLFHYRHPLKGLCLILGLNTQVDPIEAIKLIRYLFKKTNGEVLFVPLSHETNGHAPSMLVKTAQEFSIKAHAFNSFTEAFDSAKKLVDDRHGIVAIAGDSSLVSEYWKLRGIKKF